MKIHSSRTSIPLLPPSPLPLFVGVALCSRGIAKFSCAFVASVRCFFLLSLAVSMSTALLPRAKGRSTGRGMLWVPLNMLLLQNRQPPPPMCSCSCSIVSHCLIAVCLGLAPPLPPPPPPPFPLTTCCP